MLLEKEFWMRFWGEAFHVTVNVPNWAALERQVSGRMRAREGFSLATVNLDHLVKLRSDEKFRDAYAVHDLIIADGNPIVWMSKLASHPVCLIPGSDAILPLSHIATKHRRRIALVGSTENTLRKSKAFLEAKVPGAHIVATIAPPMSFDPTGESADEIIDMLKTKKADIAFLALGAPKQELFSAYARTKLRSVGFVSVGAGLDFFAGSQVRAPIWVRAICMEWLWRASSQPVRLIPRYAKCFSILPTEIAHALRLRFSDRPISPAPESF